MGVMPAVCPEPQTAQLFTFRAGMTNASIVGTSSMCFKWCRVGKVVGQSHRRRCYWWLCWKEWQTSPSVCCELVATKQQTEIAEKWGEVEEALSRKVLQQILMKRKPWFGEWVVVLEDLRCMSVVDLARLGYRIQCPLAAPWLNDRIIQYGTFLYVQNYLQRLVQWLRLICPLLVYSGCRYSNMLCVYM